MPKEPSWAIPRPVHKTVKTILDIVVENSPPEESHLFAQLLPSSDGSFQLVAPTKYGLKTCLTRPAGGVKSPPEGGVHGGSSPDESEEWKA